MEDQAILLGQAKRNTLEQLRQKAPKLREMFASEAWAEWMEWSQTLKDSLRDVALRDSVASNREEARLELLAFERFEGIPFLLAQLIQEDQAASDIPSDPREV